MSASLEGNESCGSFNLNMPKIPKPLTSAVLNGIIFTLYSKFSPTLSMLSENVLKTQMISFVGSSAIQAGIHLYDPKEESGISKWAGILLPLAICSGAPPFFHAPAKINLIVSSLALGGAQAITNLGVNYIYSSNSSQKED